MSRLIKGDRVLWVILALLAVFSFLPVFSASSNLAYVVGKGTPWGYLTKHFIILSIGFLFIYLIHKINFKYFRGVSILLMPVVILLLVYTASQGTMIGGANASRWIQIPVIGLSFQTSTFASITLMAYVASYLSKIKDEQITFKSSIFPLWLPVFAVVFLIFPANFSTAALLFLMVSILTFIGGYPSKYLMGIFGVCLFLVVLFFLTAKAFPNTLPNRIDTWMSRIESFSNREDSSGNYQVERAKIAIATGGVFGLGAGKSVMKNFLPQSSSDFIYAIIVEEFGLIGGIGLVVLYLLLLFRVVVIAYQTKDFFGKLLVMGMGLPIVLQAFINMAVALQVVPVTGQTLPMISSGGTSAWMTCVALGTILSVSAANKLKSEKELDTNEYNPIAVLSETV